jgi:hypothetical protein
MSTKTEIVVCRASYRKVFPAISRRVSFSTDTPVFDNLTGVNRLQLFYLGQRNDQASHFCGTGIFNQYAQGGGVGLGLHVLMKRET